MGKSPEAMKSKENYEFFKRIVAEHIEKEKLKEAQEKAEGKTKKK